MLKNLIKLFRREEQIQIPVKKVKKVYRLKYPDVTEEEVSKSKSKIKKKRVVKNKKRKDDVEDVEGAVELLLEAARKLACPFCRARLVNEISYLLTYDYKNKLIESGVDPKDVDSVFEERYARIVRKRVEKIKKELGIGDFELKQAAKEKAKELLG